MLKWEGTKWQMHHFDSKEMSSVYFTSIDRACSLELVYLKIYHHIIIQPVSVWCWATVFDGGPTLNQRWIEVKSLSNRKRHTRLCMRFRSVDTKSFVNVFHDFPRFLYLHMLYTYIFYHTRKFGQFKKGSDRSSDRIKCRLVYMFICMYYPANTTLTQHQTSIGLMYRVCIFDYATDMVKSWATNSEAPILNNCYPVKWNESGFRPPLCTYRLNWARRTSWGWWDDWDDTVLQTQDSIFEPWRSEAEHATSRSRRLPTILTFTRGWGRNNFCFFQTAETGSRTPDSGVKGSGANHYPRAPARYPVAMPAGCIYINKSTCELYKMKTSSPADTIRWIIVGLALVQRRRRWTSAKPALIQRLVSAGSGLETLKSQGPVSMCSGLSVETNCVRPMGSSPFCWPS